MIHDPVRELIEIASRVFVTTGPVYQIGSRWSDTDEDDEGLRPLFPGRTFLGIDERRGPGVDRVEDLPNLSLGNESAGLVLCVERLETTYDVLGTVSEMMRVTAPGGLVMVATHFEGPPPGYPWDYWRITPNCLARLLGGLDALLVGWQGPECRPHTGLAIGCRGPVPTSFAAQADAFISAVNGRSSTSSDPGRRRPDWRRTLTRWLPRRWRIDARMPQHAMEFTLQLPEERSGWRSHLRLRPA